MKLSQGPELALGCRYQRLRRRPDVALPSPAEAWRQGDGNHRGADQGRRHLPRQGRRSGAYGNLKAKLSFNVAGASKAAIEKIEKAGGSIKLPEKAAAE